MLERILEQEIMDSERDAREYASFDHSGVNGEFVARALELAPDSGLVLDVGTGPGDISILLAQRAPQLRVLAIDLGQHMLALARENVEKAGLASRVRVARMDAKATELPAASVDMVVCNSLVHHIPDPEILFRELRRIVRAGGGVFIKDLHRPRSLSELEQLVETYAVGASDYQRQSFYDSLHSGLTVGEIQAICERSGFRDVEVRRCSDRHWSVERRAS